MELDSARAQRQRKMLRLWRFLCVFIVILILFPVRNEFIRAALLAGILGVWGGALLLFWKRLPVCMVLLILPAALGTLFLSSRPNVDEESLRGAYIHSLKSYVGTPYIWGGETRTGIDCSGLARQGMITAECVEGLRTLNGARYGRLFPFGGRIAPPALWERSIAGGRFSNKNFRTLTTCNTGKYNPATSPSQAMAFTFWPIWAVKTGFRPTRKTDGSS